MSEGQFIEIDVITPKNGWRVMCDRYWLMRNGKALAYESGLYTRHLSPICNHMREVVEYMRNKPGFEDCEIKALSVAYFPPGQS